MSCQQLYILRYVMPTLVHTQMSCQYFGSQKRDCRNLVREIIGMLWTYVNWWNAQRKCYMGSMEISITSNGHAMQQSTTKLDQGLFNRFRPSTTSRDWNAFTGMTEGNIAKWLKKEGDKVSPG